MFKMNSRNLHFQQLNYETFFFVWFLILQPNMGKDEGCKRKICNKKWQIWIFLLFIVYI